MRLMAFLGVTVEVRAVTAVSAHDLTASALCSRPGCPEFAEPGLAECRRHADLAVLRARREVAKPEAAERKPRGYWTRERIIDAYHAWAHEHGRAPTSGLWAKAGPNNPAFPTVAVRFGTWTALVAAAAATVGSSGREPLAASPPEQSPSPAEAPSPEPTVGTAEPGSRPDDTRSVGEPLEPETSDPSALSPAVASAVAQASPGTVGAEAGPPTDIAPLDAAPPVGAPGGWSFALTGDFHRDAQRVRQEAALLRRQADALDVVADGVEQLAETAA